MYTAGIDIGSISAKAVILSDEGILGERVLFTGYNAGRAGHRVFDSLLCDLGLSADDIEYVTATGYGRNSIDFADRTATEIICHGIGAYFQDPHVRSIIDIGGQDSKVIILGNDGKVVNFAMNDKCAAGTGRFLEVMAHALETDLECFTAMSEQAEKPASISNMCTVFAESEVISLIADGASRGDIIAGIHRSVATRVASMAKRTGICCPVMMSGGVAKNSGLVRALERELDMPIAVSPRAQVNGALGAAVMGKQQLNAKDC